ncbi:winged helix-turn-helix transcriptional regulator (plasmid) [Halorientalis pallida]|uniref:winged helix-turn-helix transcriptional regulator n=1 Tax=Halorientalis pallida TaxID=2479928 RepID=UPI003C703B2F
MDTESGRGFDRTGDARGPSGPLFTDVEETLLSMQEIVGRKWQPIIVYYLLEDGPMGFSALKETVDGISSKMLSESLDDLEATGLVDRTLLSDQPVRVEYELTQDGHSLEPLVIEMVNWGAEHDVATDGLSTETTDETTPAEKTAVYVEGE